MTIDELIKAQRAKIAAKLGEREALTETIDKVRSACLAENRDPSEAEANEVRAAVESRAKVDGERKPLEDELAELEREKAADDAANTLASKVRETGTTRPAYDRVARVGQEKRTYSPDADKNGSSFLRDIAAVTIHGAVATESNERLARHMQEERVERPDQLERAVGTSAFSGLVVPQYLTDLYAPAAKAMRPLADAMNHHDLPASGMTLNISRITTATSVATHSENGAVDETNIDDTLLAITVQEAAGKQTVSRAAVDRGTGTESVLMDDLFRAYHSNLDSRIINDASTGLTNAATSIAYTDASPTVAELYPKFAQALSAVEAAMLDQASGENIAVMNSRRWYWLQNALSSTFPIMGQPGIAPQNQGTNYGEKYGAGFRGILPNGTPVVVDNNVATNLGAGTNEDEIYVLDSREAHLWEDPSAPVFIRAEQTKAETLGVLFVVYGYFAYTFQRYAHAQKLAGTGLVTPTWTGV